MPKRNGATLIAGVVLHCQMKRKTKTKQTIAIVGATGNMGAAISKSLAKGPYRLLLYANNREKIKALEQEIKKLHPSAELESLDCSVNACWEADIIIMAVPYHAEKEVAVNIKEVANQKIVVSIANPLNETFDGLVTAADTSAAEEMQKLLPHSKVVKAFNNTFAANFDKPVIDGKKADAFIAGNDEEAVAAVRELVETAGFNPVDAGALSVSGTLERMQLLLIQLGIKNKTHLFAGWKILHQ